VPVKRIVASADLKYGRPVEPDQLRVEVRDEFPAIGGSITGSLDEFVGLIPRRQISVGTVVQKQWFSAPPLVKQGDIVKVEVVRGAAKIEADGIAESTGALGETIAVLNPDSKRRFRARIESAGRVSVKGSL
jgi:flagella basal body P-ring formation protein FlgA